MDGEPVAKLSIAPRSRDDARIAAHLDTFARRVEATPPGMCPLAVQLTMLQASGAQTCGKCVPCRDGIPQLAAMLKRVVDCEADEGVLEGLRALAEMIRDASDCAIGYEAARSVLEGLDTFADEYASHVRDRVVPGGRRPDGSLRDAVPRARGRARLHRAHGGGRLRRCRQHGAQG